MFLLSQTTFFLLLISIYLHKNIGSDINVPPPTINNNNNNYPPLGPDEVDDGQYREDPSIYYKDDKYNVAPVKTAYHKPASVQTRFQQPIQSYNNHNVAPPQSNHQNVIPQEPIYHNQNQQQHNYNYQQQPINYNNYQHQPQPQHYNNYQQQNANLFNGHPATNFDLNTGSYSLTYTG